MEALPYSFIAGRDYSVASKDIHKVS
jgi:hypothetical protein